MSEETKLRLFATIVFITAAWLYVGPWWANISHEIELQATFKTCNAAAKAAHEFDICHQARFYGHPPLGKYLLTYTPAVLLLWINWLLGLRLRLQAESYPQRTVVALKFLAYVGVILSAFVSGNIATSDGKNPNIFNIFQPLVIFSGWVLSPMLIQNLLAPCNLESKTLSLRIALALMFAVTVLGALVFAMKH